MVAAEGNRGENVFLIARNYDADRNLTIIGAVGGVEGAAARVEADFSTKVAAESGFKSRGVELRGLGRGWGDVLRHRVQNIFEDAGPRCKGIEENRGSICKATTRTILERRLKVSVRASTRWPVPGGEADLSQITRTDIIRFMMHLTSPGKLD